MIIEDAIEIAMIARSGTSQSGFRTIELIVSVGEKMTFTRRVNGFAPVSGAGADA